MHTIFEVATAAAATASSAATKTAHSVSDAMQGSSSSSNNADHGNGDAAEDMTTRHVDTNEQPAATNDQTTPIAVSSADTPPSLTMPAAGQD